MDTDQGILEIYHDETQANISDIHVKPLEGGSEGRVPDPFRRSMKMGRSPMKAARSISTSSERESDKKHVDLVILDDSPEINYKVKRKRAEAPKETERVARNAGQSDVRQKMSEKAVSMINDMDLRMGNLRKVIAGNRNTKVEIKALVKAMSSIMIQLTSREIMDSIDTRERGSSSNTNIVNDDAKIPPKKQHATSTEVYGSEDISDQSTDTSLRVLEREIKTLKESKKQLEKENATLKEELKVHRKGSSGSNKIMFNEENRTWENFVKIRNANWPKSTFKNAFPAVGSMAETKHDTDILLLNESGPGGMRNKGIKNAIESRYPEIREDEGEMVAALVTTSFKNREGARTTSSRWILKVEADDKYRKLFEDLEKVREVMNEAGRTKLAAYPPGNDRKGMTTRKMMEYIFRGTEIKCLIYIKDQTVKRKDIQGENSLQKPRSTRNSDAIILRQEGKTYSELLKVVKGAIPADTEAAKALKALRKTRDGGMLIVLDQGNNESREALRKEIERVHEGKIIDKTTEAEAKTYRITEIDGETSKDEVEMAIKKELKEYAEEVIAVELRPSFGENQVATIKVGKRGIKAMDTLNKVRIGLSWCSIRERVEVVRCYRCWGYGHRRFECTVEEDKSQACAKCGGLEHHARDCNRTAKCLTCGKEGHRAGSGRCPEFRKALSRVRLLNKKKKGY